MFHYLGLHHHNLLRLEKRLWGKKMQLYRQFLLVVKGQIYLATVPLHHLSLVPFPCAQLDTKSQFEVEP